MVSIKFIPTPGSAKAFINAFLIHSNIDNSSKNNKNIKFSVIRNPLDLIVSSYYRSNDKSLNEHLKKINVNSFYKDIFTKNSVDILIRFEFLLDGLKMLLTSLGLIPSDYNSFVGTTKNRPKKDLSWFYSNDDLKLANEILKNDLSVFEYDINGSINADIFIDPSCISYDEKIGLIRNKSQEKDFFKNLVQEFLKKEKEEYEKKNLDLKNIGNSNLEKLEMLNFSLKNKREKDTLTKAGKIIYSKYHYNDK